MLYKLAKKINLSTKSKSTPPAEWLHTSEPIIIG